MKYTFICNHTGVMSGKEFGVQVDTNAGTLSQLCEDFEAFLRGCGFYFDGHIEIVEEDEPAEE